MCIRDRPISALLADRYGRRVILMMASLMIVIFGFFFTPLLGASDANSILITLSIGMALMGFTYGPLGTILSELYPTSVRYTGASLSFNLAGIVGASFAPFIALWLSANYGIEFVGYYLSLAATISLVANGPRAIRAGSPGINLARQNITIEAPKNTMMDINVLLKKYCKADKFTNLDVLLIKGRLIRPLSVKN